MTQLHSIQPVPDVRFPMSSCRVNMNEWNEWLKGKTSQWRQGGENEQTNFIWWFVV